MIPEQELWESAFLFGFGLAILNLASVCILVLDNHWKEKSSDGKWHFCHKTDDIRTYNKNSKVVEKFLTAKPKLAFTK